MARFLQWSDLHREFGNASQPVDFPMPTFDCPAGSVDGILIAGDLACGIDHVDALVEIHEAWKVPVISIRGNHEFYHNEFTSLPGRMSDAVKRAREQGHDIRVLDRESMEIAGTRLLACTLWTDFDIVGNHQDQMFGASVVINDYRKIIVSDEVRDRYLQPEDTRAMHLHDRSWLVEALRKDFDGPTVVMTHHLPVPEVLAESAGKGPYAPAYVSDLREDVLGLKVDAWISGHTHQARRGIVNGLHGPIAFTSNMMGYPGQVTNFEPYRVLDSLAPELGLAQIDIEDPELSGLPSAEAVIEGLRAPVPAM